MIHQTSPGASYRAYREELDMAVARVLESGWYIHGAEVAAFESEFGAWHAGAQVVGVGSGTDALQLAVRACGIGAGDSVITVSHTAVATVAAIELTGASVVFADIDAHTYCLSTAALEPAIDALDDGTIKAIIAVHLYGHPADMRTLSAIAKARGWYLIEDCAQACGASLDGARVGTLGDIAAFSFYPTKNLGAFGDGGAVITMRAELADRVRLLREYGWRERYISEIAGMNSRLDEMQAAILRVKLRHLDAANTRRKAIAEHYLSLLGGLPIGLPTVVPEAEHVYHQFVIRSARRDRLRDALRAAGVGTLVHYPVPVHQQPAYSDRVRRVGTLLETEAAAREVLSLPMYPELSDAEVEQVGTAVRDAVLRVAAE